MNIDFKERKPINEDQLEYVKKEIINAYFSLISHTKHDPGVIEIMSYLRWLMCKGGTMKESLGKKTYNRFRLSQMSI